MELRTTAIGSLPHHNVDSALEFSFQFDIPFLPQIPVRNPWEYMIPQALEGLPGLDIEKEGVPYLKTEVWQGRHEDLNERILQAFSESVTPNAFAAFEPSPASSSCWQAFLWELEEREIKEAKLQLAGPLTCEWAIQYSSPVKDVSLVSDQIFRLVLARSIAMVRRVKQLGIKPIFYVDEPALFGYNTKNPKHLLAMQELKLLVQTLQKEGARVGVHCCSQTHWPTLLDLKADLLSIDCQLTLKYLIEYSKELTQFLDRGGKFSYGLVPTSKSTSLSIDSADSILEDFNETLEKIAKGCGRSKAQLLDSTLITPACGLGLHSPATAETVLSLIKDCKSKLGPVVNSG